MTKEELENGLKEILGESNIDDLYINDDELNLSFVYKKTINLTLTLVKEIDGYVVYGFQWNNVNRQGSPNKTFSNTKVFNSLDKGVIISQDPLIKEVQELANFIKDSLS